MTNYQLYTKTIDLYKATFGTFNGSRKLKLKVNGLFLIKKLKIFCDNGLRIYSIFIAEITYKKSIDLNYSTFE